MEDAVKERFPKNWTESLEKLQESNETALLKMKPCGLKMKLSIKAVVFTHNGILTLIESGCSVFLLKIPLFQGVYGTFDYFEAKEIELN